MKRHVTAALAAALLWAGPALADAHGRKKPGYGMENGTNKAMQGLATEGAWVRAGAPNAKNGAAYVTIINRGMKADRLVGASSAAAAKVELHTHETDGGVMRMRRIPFVAVPARGAARLKPGGDHIMLMGLKTPLEAGEHIVLTLTFESGAEQRLKAMIMKKSPMKKIRHGG